MNDFWQESLNGDNIDLNNMGAHNMGNSLGLFFRKKSFYGIEKLFLLLPKEIELP